MSWALVNLGIIALVAFTLYYTKSLWAFGGLLFLLSRKETNRVSAKCPMCGHEFLPTSN